MRIGVIGGGIQGIGTALEFARRGARVELFERRATVMAGASRENEGKIHLGFVYAHDPGFGTARLMAEAAMRFAPALAEWLECDVADFAVSRPFLYAVHRESLLSPDELAGRYERISELVRQAAAVPGADYFGRRTPHAVRRLSPHEVAATFDETRVAGAFETAELAVDPRRIAELLTRRVEDDPAIRVRTGVVVTAARHGRNHIELSFRTPDAEGTEQVERFDEVVNCGWCGRLAVDATVGLVPDGPWSFRRKHFLRLPAAHGPRALPAVTMVLGGFGDVVPYANGALFLSWYPVGCRGLEAGLEPDRREIAADSPEAAALRAGIVAGVGQVVPGVLELPAETRAAAELRSGIIYALGDTDVNVPDSRLHRRHEVGPRSYGRYHTVDTGKYTSGPLFARQLARRVLPSRKAA